MAKPRLAPPSTHILKSLHNSIPRTAMANCLWFVARLRTHAEASAIYPVTAHIYKARDDGLIKTPKIL